MKTIYFALLGIFALAGIGACALATTAAPTSLPPTVPAAASAVPPSPIVTQPNQATGSIFTLSESDLNAQIAQGISQGEISNAHIDLLPNNLADFSATLRTGNLTLEPKISIELAVQNGQIVINVLKIEVGGFGLPSSLIETQIAQIKQTAETELNSQLAKVKSRTGMTLQSLSTTQDELVLTFAP